MINKLQSKSGEIKDSLGRRRLNLVHTNFKNVSSKLNRADCTPDFVDNNQKLKPKFDIFFADLGYNIDQLSVVQGLSYQGSSIHLTQRFTRETGYEIRFYWY